MCIYVHAFVSSCVSFKVAFVYILVLKKVLWAYGAFISPLAYLSFASLIIVKCKRQSLGRKASVVNGT